MTDQSGSRVVTPGDPDYAQACQEWNSRIEPHPKEIVYNFEQSIPLHLPS